MVICRLTLLLGPPGAGKTTLLLDLAGKLDQDLKVYVMSKLQVTWILLIISQFDLFLDDWWYKNLGKSPIVVMSCTNLFLREPVHI